MFFFFQFYTDRFNSILRYLKRKQPEKGRENNASGSGVGSNVNECQRDGGNESESNTHKSGGNGPSGVNLMKEVSLI